MSPIVRGRRVHIIDGRLTDLVHNSTSEVRAKPVPRQQIGPCRAVAAPASRLRDLFNESLAGMFARPGRHDADRLGVVIGLTALVATLGLSRTAGNRIVSQFDQVAATELFVSARGPALLALSIRKRSLGMRRHGFAA